MPQLIDLEGLPEPVAKAIAETVSNLKTQYQVAEDRAVRPLKELPTHSGRVIGSLRRVEIYEDR